MQAVAITGVHPVLEALKSGRPVERIAVLKGGGARLQEIVERARQRSIPVRFEDRASLDRLAGTAAHQGVVALAAAHRYAALEDLLDQARLLVLLDGVEDPHNLGAIVRTAHAAGADAVVVPERRAAGLTETVAKTAAGALEHLPVARVVNLARAIEQLKERRFWIYGLDERGSEEYDRAAYLEPTAFVFGGEGKGLHDGIKKHCDVLVRIPMAGQIPSLNVSVAAGVVLFEWRRRMRR
jgi:23S rRNA (guanosine2251-2'-O)-methyltransferase